MAPISSFLIVFASLVALLEGSSVDDSFLSWFEENKGERSSVAIAHQEGMGRGISAAKDLVEGDVLYQIPQELIITASLVRKSTHRPHKSLAKLAGKNDDALIALYLIYERDRGESSFFAPYFKVLPENVPNLSTFSAEELDELQDPTFMQRVQRDQEKNAAFFGRIASQLKEFYGNVFQGRIGGGPSTPTLTDYIWAKAIVDSRGLRFRGRVHLAPLACMMNYDPHPDSRKAQSGEFFLEHHRLDPSTGALTVSTDRPTAKGKSVFEDYGDNPDYIYAEYHGFVPSVNPFRCIDVNMPPVSPGYEMRGPKIALLRSLGLGSAPSACIGTGAHVSLDGEITADPLSSSTFKLGSPIAAYLSVMAMTADETEACEAAVAAGKVSAALDLNALPGAVDVACAVTSTREFLDSLLAHEAAVPAPIDATPVAWHHAAEGSRENRLVSSLQAVLMHSYGAHRATSTLAADLDSLRALNGRTWGPSEERQALALRYRMAAKSMWQAAVTSFGFHWSPFESGVTTFAEGLASDLASVDLWHVDESLEEQLHGFNAWFNRACEKAGAVNKLAAASIPGFRIGTVATRAIAPEEVYIEVPSRIIMDAGKALMGVSGVAPLIRNLRSAYRRADTFIELLLFLLHERLVVRDASPFWPYLRMLPTPSELDLPPSWNASNPNRIALERFHSYTVRSIDNYRTRNEMTFPRLAAVPQVKEFFDGLPGVFTPETYHWAVTVLDSRSIWWDGERHLVPMLDFINCVEGPDPTRLHATALDEKRDVAVTKAGWAFASGAQVFENYGQPNHIYLTYHGFALKENTHDCATMALDLTPEEHARVDWRSENTIRLLRSLRIVPGNPNAAIDSDEEPPSIESVGTEACLTSRVEDIPRQVWAMAALKAGVIEDYLGRGLLGKPEASTGQALQQAVASHLSDIPVDYATIANPMVRIMLEGERAILTELAEALLTATPSMPSVLSDEL